MSLLFLIPFLLYVTPSASINTAGAMPPLESILYNPAVSKQQLGAHRVAATSYWAPGRPQFIVHFYKNTLHGSWQSFYNNGQLCDSGRFEKNIPDGVWKTWYPDGRVKTVRTYNAEKYHYVKADVARNHPKAWRYALTKLGNRAAAFFKPNYGTAESRPQPMLQKVKQNTSGEAQFYQAPFAACLHHGSFVNYDATGNATDSGHYVNGLPEGLWKKSDGAGVSEGFYHQGRRHGQWKFYNLDGRLLATQWYRANGKAVNTHHFK